MIASDDALQRWHRLGDVLARLAEDLDEIVVELWRSHVEVVIGFAGEEVAEATRAKLLASDPFSRPAVGGLLEDYWIETEHECAQTDLGVPCGASTIAQFRSARQDRSPNGDL